MYDVIVVGARCAGASTAMLLGRKGYKVLIDAAVEAGVELRDGFTVEEFTTAVMLSVMPST